MTPLENKPDKLNLKLDIDPRFKEKQLELLRLFAGVFDNVAGKKVLDILDAYSKKNFPNYENVNATYEKIGEQILVAYIRAMVDNAKKGGE